MSHVPTDILDTILQRMNTLAKTETIVGDPVTIDNMTLLPVIKISVGFAAGGGEGKGEKDKAVGGTGSFGGGGGGASITPVGFITWDGEKTKFVPVGKGGKLDALVESVPGLLKKFGINLRKGSEEKDEKDKKKKKEEKSDEDEEIDIEI